MMLTLLGAVPSHAAEKITGQRTCTLPRLATTYGTGAGNVWHYHNTGGWEYGQQRSNQTTPIYKTWTYGVPNIANSRITYTISLTGYGVTCEQ